MILENWIRQFVVLSRKNFILQARYWKTTLAQTVIAPIIVLLLLFLLQQAQNQKNLASNPHPLPYNLDGLQKCQGLTADVPCITLMFTPPTDTQIVSIMQSFAQKNQQRTGVQMTVETNVLSDTSFVPTQSMDIVPVSNADFIYDYTLKNPNVTLFGVHFDVDTSTPTTNYRYQIWYNHTQTANDSDPFGMVILQLMRGIDEAIISTVSKSSNQNAPDTTFKIQLKDFPLIPPTLLGQAIVEQLGAVFFFCSTMFIFIVALNTIVSEKEMHLRSSMEMAGLQSSVYWITWLVTEAVLVFVNALVVVCFGIAFQFTIFTDCNFGVLFFTFFLFGLAMVTFAFFITTMCRKARVAVLVGIFICIIGLLFMSFIFSSAEVGYLWYSSSVSPGFADALIFLPFFNFGKLYLDISSRTTGKSDMLTQTYIPGPGFAWGDLHNDIPSNLLPTYSSQTPVVPQPIYSYYYLLMNMAVFIVLTWFLDSVIPDEYGSKKPLWFFLMPSYWGFGKKKTSEVETEWLKQVCNKSLNEKFDDIDDDVAEEESKALDPNFSATVRIVHLRKEFHQSVFRKSKLDKTAVKNTCLTLQEGKLLALLGQNGAGKSTTMNILAGLTPPTSGDALFYGHSISDNMIEIRRNLGVCPQHDILFQDLTSKEHFYLYAGIKNVPPQDIPKLMEERLKAVRLWKVLDKKAGTYSGGMKRRLSLVLSTIGDPKVIFLDEPTTGMDPVNRRHVWSFVEKFKRDKVIILTTHSMEEADVLGDRIAIMAHGRLRALGNSIHLKNKFGAGYRVSLVTSTKLVPVLQEKVIEFVPNAVLEDASAGALIYQIPNNSMHLIPSFVRYLENANGETPQTNPEDEPLVQGWSISQTTLEEVFLRIIREANKGGYSGYEKEEADPSSSFRRSLASSAKGKAEIRRRSKESIKQVEKEVSPVEAVHSSPPVEVLDISEDSSPVLKAPPL